MPQPLSPSAPFSQDGSADIAALLGTLRASYPDLSRFTVVSMTGRGRDALHHLLHTGIGGLLPTVLAFDDYQTRRIAASAGRLAVSENEAFLRFHSLRCREEGRALAPADTQRLLAFLSTLAEFSVSVSELGALDRVGSEQLERIDRLFAMQESFRACLASEGLFYPPFEVERLSELAPGEDDLFVGLPLMTPVNQRFFSLIPRDRRYADAPLFGPHMPTELPDYETALSLVRRMGIAERRVSGEGLAFTELSERAAIPALLAREIDAFLRRPPGVAAQLFLVPLDERLSFYLWECLFRRLGGQVNFSPWLPFAHFSVAHRLRGAVRGGPELTKIRRDLVSELAVQWQELDEAERSAFEAAITLCDEVERFRPLMGDAWGPLADYMIAAKKLRLRGSRNAPIQVVGLGDAPGIPYERAVILPMNSGIFPKKPFHGPYLNLVHLPRISRAQYEADDLALRQFLALGHTAHIAALYDQAGGEAPSPHFAFLAAEFGKTAVKRRLAPAPFTVRESPPVIENTADLREKLRRYAWSFTALRTFLTCPYRFVLERLQGVTPPPCLDDEDSAHVLVGEFLHRFFADLKGHPPALEQWQRRFDAAWDGDAALREKLPDSTVRRALVSSHLADIAAWEREKGRPLLFADTVTDVELDLKASFGGGRYGLRGRIDRLQLQDDVLLVTDLKYREKQTTSSRLAERLDDVHAFDDRFQLLFYVYLALRNGKAVPGRVTAAHLFLRPRVRGDYVGRLSPEDVDACDAVMEGIAQRLDARLAEEDFRPNYRAQGCPSCPYKALCLRPDLYRTGGRSW